MVVLCRVQRHDGSGTTTEALEMHAVQTDMRREQAIIVARAVLEQQKDGLGEAVAAKT